MTEQKTTADTHKTLFFEFVIMLSTSAMQQLGKIINPLTGKTEVNLEGAQATIDLVEMLQAKTTGNLEKDEERLLRTTLSTLQMNYVETAQSMPAAPVAEQKAEAAPAQDKASPTEGPATVPPKDGQEPRYHKSYG